MECLYCHTINEPTAIFCAECGRVLRQPAEAVPPQEERVPAGDETLLFSPPPEEPVGKAPVGDETLLFSPPEEPVGDETLLFSPPPAELAEKPGVPPAPSGRIGAPPVAKVPVTPSTTAKKRPRGVIILASAGVAFLLLCIVAAIIRGRSLLLSRQEQQEAMTATQTAITAIVARQTPTPPATATSTSTSTNTPIPTYTPLPPTATPAPTSTPTETPTPTPRPKPTKPKPAVDFKVASVRVLTGQEASCGDPSPALHLYVRDLQNKPLDNIRLDVWWDGTHIENSPETPLNSGWHGPGYVKVILPRRAYSVQVLGDVPPFGDCQYNSEATSPLDTASPPREYLQAAGYCQAGGDCVQCVSYSWEVVFQRQW